MHRYPLLVKIVHGKVSLVEDDFGDYSHLVADWAYVETQFCIVTSDEELGDIEESCATSEGADSVVILGHVDYNEFETLGKYMLRMANQTHERYVFKCPKCGSSDSDLIGTDYDTDDFYEESYCRSCGTEWKNYYRMYDQQIE